jgi:hypothetical protein
LAEPTDAVDEIENATNEACPSAALGQYTLAVKGEKAFLLDNSGSAVWSCNAGSLDSFQKKKQLIEVTKCSATDIDEATAKLLFSLEREHEDRETREINRALNAVEKNVTLSEGQLNVKGLELLEHGELLSKAKEVYDKGVLVDKYRFVLGEDDGKLLMSSHCYSAVSRWPQSVFVTGGSGFGKTNLVLVALCQVPAEWAKILSYVTPAALRYSPNQDYKILFIKEHRRTGEQDIRLIKNEDGGYTYEIAVRDPDSGQMTTQTGSICAKTVIETSTSLSSVESLRRDWLRSVNESPELTSKINHRKAEYRAGKIQPSTADELAIIQHAVAQLDPQLDVVIPYAEQLEDLTAWDRSRFDDLLDEISFIAWIHQKQRPVDNQGRIIATPADLYLALRIAGGTLLQSLQKLPVRLGKVLDVLPGTNSVTGLTVKELVLERKIGESTARQYRAEVQNLGYVVGDQKQGTRENQYWRLESPSVGTAELLLKKTFSNPKWAEIVNSVKRALEQADPVSAELLNGVWSVTDPLADDAIVRLDADHIEIPGSALQQIKKRTDSDDSEQKEAEAEHLPAEPENQQQISTWLNNHSSETSSLPDLRTEDGQVTVLRHISGLTHHFHQPNDIAEYLRGVGYNQTDTERFLTIIRGRLAQTPEGWLTIILGGP